MAGSWKTERAIEALAALEAYTFRDRQPSRVMGGIKDYVTSGGQVTELALHKSEGKPAVADLDPTFILEMGGVMTQGLEKYPNDPDGRPNWWKGGAYRGFCASIIRHAMALASGEDFDAESGQAHAAHIAVDAMFIRSWQRRGVGQDNRLV